MRHEARYSGGRGLTLRTLLFGATCDRTAMLGALADARGPTIKPLANSEIINLWVSYIKIVIRSCCAGRTGALFSKVADYIVHTLNEHIWAMSDALDDDDNTDPDAERYWTKIGRINDILSVLFFPLALFSGLTGVGLLTYFGSAGSPSAVSPPPRAGVQPVTPQNPARDEAGSTAPITPKVVKTESVVMPPVSQGEDETSTDGRRPAEAPPTRRDESLPKKSSTQGWIYAGSYPTRSYYSGPYYKGPCRHGGCPTGWTSSYLDFSTQTDPRELNGKVLHPLTHSYVRSDHPSLKGPAPPFGIVAPNTRLVVNDVFVRNRGQEVWLKVEIYGSVLPLNFADLEKAAAKKR